MGPPNLKPKELDLPCKTTRAAHSRFWKPLITIAFTLGTFYLIFRANAFEDLFGSFKQVGATDLPIFFLLFIGMRLLQAGSLAWIMKIQRVRLRFHDALELSALKGFYNLGFSGAGLVAQAIRARSSNFFTVRQLAWATLLLSLLLISTQGIMLAVTSLIFFHQKTMMIFGTSVGVIFGLLPLLILYLVKHGLVPRLVVPIKIYNLLEEFGILIAQSTITNISVAWLLQASLVILRVGRIVLIAYLLDADGPAGIFAAITLSADLATVVPLTPGGIGLREFVIGLGAGFVGHLELFIAAAVIDRAVTLIGNLTHGLWVISTSFQMGGKSRDPR